MTFHLVQINLDNLQLAIDTAISTFGEYDRAGIEYEFKASLGIAPEKNQISSDLYIDELQYFLAYDDDQPIGVTGYYTIQEHQDEIWLGWMGLLPEGRGNGNGSKLCSEPFNAAAHKEPKVLRIWTTLEPAYDAARALYRKLGFVEESYNPEATDAGSLVVVFSKSASAEPLNPNLLWKNTHYPIDCEKYVIPSMNKEMERENHTFMQLTAQIRQKQLTP